MSDQQQIDLRQQFLDILIDLKTTHGVQQARIAEMLHVSPSHISRIKKGDSPSAHLLLALRSIHKDHFSKAEGSEIQIREQSRPYGIVSTVEVETWAEDTGLTVEEFTRKCLDRYGPMLFKDLKHAHERRNLKRAQPSPDEPAGDVAKRMIDQKEKEDK